MSEVLSSGSFPFQEVSVDTICISTLFITEQPEKSLGQVRKAPPKPKQLLEDRPDQIPAVHISVSGDVSTDKERPPEY